MVLGPFMCPLGPILGPFNPAASDIVFWQERQIVRPTLGLHGFLPEIGEVALRLTSRGIGTVQDPGSLLRVSVVGRKTACLWLKPLRVGGACLALEQRHAVA